MKIVFMGTPEFAVASLDILIKHGYNVSAVVTAPDSFGGRGGKQLIQSAIKKYALENSTKLRSNDFIAELQNINADLFVVVAFRMLPEVIWNMPKFGTINLHGSLLPKYRGAAPIHHAVINGDIETGVTTFRLKHEIDTGDIILQSRIPIHESDNTGDVHDRMMKVGAETVLQTVKKIEEGNVVYLKQTDSEASHAPKLFHNNTEINFYRQNAQEVYNLIRGLSPFPGAWCQIGDLEYKIYKSNISQETLKVGQIRIDSKKMTIGCKNGSIEILEIKPEGKRLMTTQEFINGNHLDSEFVKNPNEIE
jgi:methionyl-tRNA formyltransferase